MHTNDDPTTMSTMALLKAAASTADLLQAAALVYGTTPDAFLAALPGPMQELRRRAELYDKYRTAIERLEAGTHKVFRSLHVSGSETGRWSSAAPNQANMPKTKAADVTATEAGLLQVDFPADPAEPVILGAFDYPREQVFLCQQCGHAYVYGAAQDAAHNKKNHRGESYHPGQFCGTECENKYLHTHQNRYPPVTHEIPAFVRSGMATNVKLLPDTEGLIQFPPEMLKSLGLEAVGPPVTIHDSTVQDVRVVGTPKTSPNPIAAAWEAAQIKPSIAQKLLDTLLELDACICDDGTERPECAKCVTNRAQIELYREILGARRASPHAAVWHNDALVLVCPDQPVMLVTQVRKYRILVDPEAVRQFVRARELDLGPAGRYRIEALPPDDPLLHLDKIVDHLFGIREYVVCGSPIAREKNRTVCGLAGKFVMTYPDVEMAVAACKSVQ